MTCRIESGSVRRHHSHVFTSKGRQPPTTSVLAPRGASPPTWVRPLPPDGASPTAAALVGHQDLQPVATVPRASTLLGPVVGQLPAATGALPVAGRLLPATVGLPALGQLPLIGGLQPAAGGLEQQAARARRGPVRAGAPGGHRPGPAPGTAPGTGAQQPEEAQAPAVVSGRLPGAVRAVLHCLRRAPPLTSWRVQGVRRAWRTVRAASSGLVWNRGSPVVVSVRKSPSVMAAQRGTAPMPISTQPTISPFSTT